MIFANGKYYRVKVKAKNNLRHDVDFDLVFQLDNCEFKKKYGFHITCYEASLMKANISPAKEKDFLECNKNEEYRKGNLF